MTRAVPPPSPAAERPLTAADRIAAIRQTKMAQTAEKQRVIGAMDYDDWALILPPEDRREMVESVSGSGVAIHDVLLSGVDMVSDHQDGGFYGPRACGANFRRLLEAHPPYVDPVSSLAGGYMANFGSYRKHGWPPERPVPASLRARREKYRLAGAIGGAQHFCQDLQVGLDLGWRGILAKIARHRREHTGGDREAFYDGLEEVVRGLQSWIRNTAAEARGRAGVEPHPQLRDNLLEVAAMNERLVTEPPATFREACQWTLWYDMAARMYNGSGSLGRLDVLLGPYYGRESAAGALTDDEAILHLACLLARDTAYLQVGGPDAEGRDVTNRVSYLILEAAQRLKIPCNVGVCVGAGVDPGLLRRGVEILVEDRLGIPKFLGIDRTTEGFARNGIPLPVARTRAYSGCHWSALPGREYTLNDCVKLSFGNVFDVALRDMLAGTGAEPGVDRLWARFEEHMREAVRATAESIDFHLQHMKDVFPELVLDLLCHGPIETGLDASDGFGGGVEYYNLCVDGCALATVADSFAAVEEHVERRGRLTWQQLLAHLDRDWAGQEGERARLLMKRIPRYGSGGSRADAWARRISVLFTDTVKAGPTPAGFNMIPGIFSWANTIPLGKVLGATPNGRHAGEPISHGANPDPGFRPDGAPTALAVAIASVQPGYGNTAPMQIELDPGAVAGEEAVDNVSNLIRTHFELGGTQVNINVLDRERILEAHEDPSKYPDLVVRVTGFSAYFASLSPAFRQLVVDRILNGS